jgi:hypothetical protein
LLWGLLLDGGALDMRARAACLLAELSPDGEGWAAAAPGLVDWLLAQGPLAIGHWANELRPVAAVLVPSLAARFRAAVQAGANPLLPATLLADYAAGQPDLLAELLTEADGPAAEALRAPLLGHRAAAVAALRAVLAQSPAGRTAEREALARRQARAAVALIRFDDGEPVWPLFRHAPMPDLRSELIHELGPLGADAAAITRQLRAEGDVSAQRALVLSLGEFPPAAVAKLRQELTPWLVERYHTHPDAGLHAAIAWLLRGPWASAGAAALLDAVDRAARGLAPAGERSWYVSPAGRPMTVVSGPVTFRIGLARGRARSGGRRGRPLPARPALLRRGLAHGDRRGAQRFQGGPGPPGPAHRPPPLPGVQPH